MPAGRPRGIVDGGVGLAWNPMLHRGHGQARSLPGQESPWNRRSRPAKFHAAPSCASSLKNRMARSSAWHGPHPQALIRLRALAPVRETSRRGAQKSPSFARLSAVAARVFQAAVASGRTESGVLSFCCGTPAGAQNASRRPPRPRPRRPARQRPQVSRRSRGPTGRRSSEIAARRAHPERPRDPPAKPGAGSRRPVRSRPSPQIAGPRPWTLDS